MVNSQISAAREEYKLGVTEEELLRQRIADKAARSNTEGQLKWQKRQEKLRGFGETVSSKQEEGSGFVKVGRVFPMVVVSILSHKEFGPNDHRKGSPHFI